MVGKTRLSWVQSQNPVYPTWPQGTPTPSGFQGPVWSSNPSSQSSSFPSQPQYQPGPSAPFRPMPPRLGGMSQSSSFPSQETQLPFDEGVQDDILSLMCQDPSFMDASSYWLKASYFKGEHRREMVSTMLSFYQRYSAGPTLGQLRTEMMVRGRFDGKEGEELNEYINEAYQRVVRVKDYTVDVVSEFAQTQAWIEAVTTALPLIQTRSFKELNELMKKAAEVGNFADAGVYWLFEEMEQRSFLRTDESFRIEYVIPTGIYDLDKLFRWGGPCRGEMGCLVAPTNGGKSIGLGHMAKRAVYNNSNVFIASFEMKEDKYADRLDAAFTGFSMADLMREQELFLEAMTPLSKRFKGKVAIKQYPTGSSTIADVEKTLQVLKRRDGWVPDMIILDYAGIVAPSIRRGDNRHLEVQQVMQEFRAMCIKYNAVGWTAMQASKKGELAYWIRGEHVATSWDSLSDCDHVISINATDAERAGLDEDGNHINSGMVRLFAIKIRDGIPKVKIGPLICDWKAMQFIQFVPGVQ